MTLPAATWVSPDFSVKAKSFASKSEPATVLVRNVEPEALVSTVIGVVS